MAVGSRLVTAHEDLHRDLTQRVLIHRRRFLGMLAAGGGALVLGACSSDDEGRSGSGRDEGDATTTAPEGTTTTPEVPAADGIDADPFLLGVSSGDPLPSSVILWTRLVTDLVDRTGFGGLGETDHQVLWEMATDDSFAVIVASGIESAPAEFGHSVHVDASGLASDTWYAYRFRIGDYTSPVGRTRTTPADDATPDQLKIAFASCQVRQAGWWTSYEHLVAGEPDLVLFLGDYIYEYPGGEGDQAIPLETEPVTLADYRVLYAAYQRDRSIQAAHGAAPWIVTWDDHEAENNYAAGIAENEADQDGFADRRRAAYQAYYEHLPLRVTPPAADGSLELYRSVRYGTLAEFFVLDGRQYRSDQVCGDKLAINRNACPEIDGPDSTMLGAEQEAWLTKGLAETDATWKVLAQQTVMKALVLGDIVLNVDQWDGYPAARSRLLTTIDESQLANVVVLTGDIHAGGAANIRLPDAGAEGKIVAHELVCPGISSEGIGALGEALDLSTIGLTYANFADNGYVRATITPERWTTEFMVVDTIAEPAASIRVDGAVEITAGTPGMRSI